MKDDGQSRNSSAASRAEQISGHIAPDTSKTNSQKRRSRKKEDALPADYSDILGQLRTLRHLANNPPLTTGFKRQREAGQYSKGSRAEASYSPRGCCLRHLANLCTLWNLGKLWVRDRILALLDERSFREIGSATGHVKWKQLDDIREEPEAFTPFNNLQGFGKLRGRQVVFTADDFSIRAGHQDGHLMAKTVYTEQMATSMRIPIIKLVDG